MVQLLRPHDVRQTAAEGVKGGGRWVYVRPHRHGRRRPTIRVWFSHGRTGPGSAPCGSARRPHVDDFADWARGSGVRAEDRTPEASTGWQIRGSTFRHWTRCNRNGFVACNHVSALWLGHESVETTYIYLHAGLELKGRATAVPRKPGEPSISQVQPGAGRLNIFSFLSPASPRPQSHLNSAKHPAMIRLVHNDDFAH